MATRNNLPDVTQQGPSLLEEVTPAPVPIAPIARKPPNLLPPFLNNNFLLCVKNTRSPLATNFLTQEFLRGDNAESAPGATSAGPSLDLGPDDPTLALLNPP